MQSNYAYSEINLVRFNAANNINVSTEFIPALIALNGSTAAQIIGTMPCIASGKAAPPNTIFSGSITKNAYTTAAIDAAMYFSGLFSLLLMKAIVINAAVKAIIPAIATITAFALLGKETKARIVALNASESGTPNAKNEEKIRFSGIIISIIVILPNTNAIERVACVFLVFVKLPHTITKAPVAIKCIIIPIIPELCEKSSP